LRPWGPGLGASSPANVNGGLWITSDLARTATHFRVTVAAALPNDLNLEFLVGATIGTLTSQVAFVLVAGLLTLDFNNAVPIPAGGYMTLQFDTAANIASFTNAIEVLVRLE
jgi:hypothetical protein